MRVEAGAPQYYLRRRRQARVRRIKRIALAASVLALGGIVLGLIVYAGSPDRLASGTRIAGVNVGGLETTEAQRLLEDSAASVRSEPIVFTADGQSVRISAADIDLRVDWAAAVDTARSAGDGVAPLRGLRRLKLRFFGAEVDPHARYDAAALEKRIAEVAAVVDVPPREAALRRKGLTIDVVPAQAGNVIDREAAVGRIVASLSSFERGARISLPMRLDPPDVTLATLAPALHRARVAVSKPARLTLGPATYKVPRWRIASLLDLPSKGEKKLAIGGPGATKYFKELEQTVNRPPRNAQFVVFSGGIKVKPHVNGQTLDVEKTADALLGAVTKIAPAKRTAPMAVTIVEPKRTTKDARAMGINGIVGSYTTYYGGVPGRLHNVALVSRLIDDHLIAPGKEFSFNGTTGERTAEKGFQEAPVIINGELQTALGGGVCQVSTTVFNAAYEAGLKITERTNHALYISHYPQGRDATVNYPDLDLKFVNDTNKWLLLRTFVSSGSLTVNLYGTPQNRKVESATSALAVTGPAPLQKELDPELEKGEKVVMEAGSPSRATSVTRRVYTADGELLYENTWYSSYRGEKKVVRIGTKKPEKPAKKKPLTDEEKKAAESISVPH